MVHAFPGLGTLVNAAAVVAGSTLGMLAGHRLPERTRSVVTDCLGLATLLMAALSAADVRDPALAAAVGPSAPVLVVLGALVIGGAAGSLLRIEDRLAGLAARVHRVVAAELRALGGASVVLATVTVPDAMTPALGGLRPRGQLVVVGASADPMQVPPFALIPGSTAIQGHASGTSKDSEDTLGFSVLTDVRPMVETMPLEQAQAAYDTMMSGDARFRMVLTTGR